MYLYQKQKRAEREKVRWEIDIPPPKVCCNSTPIFNRQSWRRVIPIVRNAQSCYNGYRKERKMDGELKDSTPKDIQWHPAFVSAMNLEFSDNRKDLMFQREYNLNIKPLEIDLLIIKKEKGVTIQNEIGHFFREYNILEYKAPGDHLNVDSYYKAVAYGCLYKAYGETVDERKADDITISLLRDAKPQGLFRYFADAGTAIRNVRQGIYCLSGDKVLFPTQVIVIKELAEENHAYLRILTQKPKKEDVSRFLELYKNLSGKAEREYAESILEVFTEANEKWVEQWKGEDGMGPALMRIMEPELREAKKQGIEEGIERGIEKGIEKGILGAVDILQNLGLSSIEIKKAVMERYGLTEKETEKYL